ncbi:hypothetical protein GCM10008107_05210 [Psychrosphaera saromensis]|nr:hypothetical protein GCM10008107_05210 [Psychrosphaera saromensis]GLQ14242.1 hypothetical protein GCM10007917_16970 [Psychrosphaera saromensis]
MEVEVSKTKQGVHKVTILDDESIDVSKVEANSQKLICYIVLMDL